jgi:hypothetical protein
MAEIDAELLERVARWCADAGRQAGTREIRAALSPLSWDELLAARAILADPPPARPLGPHALADMARGTPADTAAERERDARYPREAADEPVEPVEPAAPPPAATPRSRGDRRGSGKGKKAAGIVVHRARDRVVASAPPPPAPPALDELRRDEGRAVLERLLRRHGGRRAAILAALGAGWCGPGGAAPTGPDLDALLDLHGLSRAFEHREHDEVLHALRAAGGSRAAAAATLGLDEPGLEASLARLGAAGEAERIREERRSDLRVRATLSERVHLVLAQEERLRDLGLLGEFEQDLRARLPEHLRALRAAGEPLVPALSRSLSLPFEAVTSLASRLGVELGARGAQRPGGEAPRARVGLGAPRREFRPGGRRASASPGRGGAERGRDERRPRGDRPAYPGRPGRASGPARPFSSASPRGRPGEAQARGGFSRGGTQRPGDAQARGGFSRGGTQRSGGAQARGGFSRGGTQRSGGAQARGGFSRGGTQRPGGRGERSRGGPASRGAGPTGSRSVPGASGPAPRPAPGARRPAGRAGSGPAPRGGHRGPPSGSRAGTGRPRGAGPASRGGKPPRRG